MLHLALADLSADSTIYAPDRSNIAGCAKHPEKKNDDVALTQDRTGDLVRVRHTS